MNKQTSKEHFERFEAFAVKLEPMLSSIAKDFPPRERLVILLEANEHLNNIDITEFDSYHSAIQRAAFAAKIKFWSMSYTVCTIKHYLIYKVAGVVPEFIQ